MACNCTDDFLVSFSRCRTYSKNWFMDHIEMVNWIIVVMETFLLTVSLMSMGAHRLKLSLYPTLVIIIL